MKKNYKIFLLILILVFPFIVNATEVTNEDGLRDCLNNNNECKVTEDITLNSTISIGDETNNHEVILDLNGKNIIAGENLEATTGMILVRSNTKLTINDASGNGKISTGTNTKVYAALQVTEKDHHDENKTAELVINGGTFEGYYYGIVGNGTRHNTKITINNGTIKGLYENDSYGIYQPQKGILTINDGIISGSSTGIEIRSGDLIVNGGSIKGNGNHGTSEPNGNGTTTSSTGIAVAQHTTKLPINVTINGGTIEGYSAFYESNPQRNSEENIKDIKLTINNGTFNTINEGTTTIYSQDKTGFIHGGNFDKLIETKYISENTPLVKITKDNKDSYHVGEDVIKNKVSSLVSGNIIEVISGDLNLTIRTSGVKVTNKGDGTVKINNKNVLKDKTLTVRISSNNNNSNEEEKVTINIENENETDKTLTDTLETCEDIPNINDVTVNVKINNITLTTSDIEKIKKVLKNTVENAIISDFFDINVIVKNKIDDTEIKKLHTLKNEIVLKINLTKELKKVPEGYVRKYYVIRNHNGEIKVLDNVKLSKDGNSVLFSSDKFSTYALAYKDVTNSEKDNPETSDNIIIFISFIIISSILINSLYFKKIKN